MNEQIKQLWEEAAKTTQSDSWEEQTKFMERFAELIVRECANQCDLLLDHKISSEWARGTHDCSKAIKKHFRVEE